MPADHIVMGWHAMEVHRLWELAHHSVARGSGFALLAIFCTMIGLAGFPAVALKTGGVCLMLGAGVLALKASRSDLTPYKRTELWLLLEPHERPSGSMAQTVIARARRDAFVRYALLFVYGGSACLLLGVAADFIAGAAVGIPV
jgi:hypothetical protein